MSGERVIEEPHLFRCGAELFGTARWWCGAPRTRVAGEVAVIHGVIQDVAQPSIQRVDR